MIIAQERSKVYGDLLSHIHGIIFLGTPHRGSDLAWWATFAAEILKAGQLGLGRGTNTAYVEALKKNSAEFSHISQQWIERSETLQIRTFYETEKLSGILVSCFCRSGGKHMTDKTPRLWIKTQLHSVSRTKSPWVWLAATTERFANSRMP